MEIKLEWSVDHWRADMANLPGKPPVGLGATKELAVACLFWRLIFEDAGGLRPRSWIEMIDRKKPIVVDGQTWSWPESYVNSR